MNYLRYHKLLACLLCSTIIFTVIPNNINKSVNADTIVNYEGDKPSSDCSYRSVEEAYYTAEVKTTNKWSGHSNIEIKFKNTGTETIHDWYFTFDFNYKIENPINCKVIESKDNLYTIGNNDWNQDIKPGQSVTVGFTASSKNGSEIKDMPTFYLLNTQTVTLKSGDLKYKYEEYSNWSSGFNGALILTNKTKETIRDWTITFGANRPITQADSSVFTDNGDGTYTITNDGNNQNIAKGQSYRIGIQGGSNDPSKAFTLTDFTATAKKMALKLTDDKDKNGIADVLEVDFNGTVTVTPTEAPTSTPTATSTPSATATPKATNSPTSTPKATNTPTVKPTNTARPTSTSTPKPTATQKPTVTNTPTSKPTVTNSPRPTATNTPTAKPSNTATPVVTVTPGPSVTATPTASPTPDISVSPTNTVTTTPSPTAMPTGIPDDIDYEKDTDKDGLPDDLEDYHGTDKNKKDTDGDGVNDLYEIILETDPLTKDDNGSKDADNDGLTNAKESQIGTNPKNRDSDLDGLTDGAEVNLHGTDPQKYDTDDDGISDAGEISLGSNPNKKDSDILRRQTLTFYPKADSKLKGITKVEVSGYISGYIEENTKIRDISDSDPQTASIEALVGVPIDVETTGDFDSMYIRFYYEEGDFDEDDLRVLWYDEENCQYVMLDVEDSRISYDANYFQVYTEHFSKYMLIDQGAWVKTWANGMRQAGGTSALGRNYTLDGFKNDLKDLPDSDEDGLPDVLEINGMITNTGKVIRTNPNNPDSDDDTIPDGEEMGEMCLTNKVFEYGTFEFFIRYWTPEYGYRYFEYVYFCMKSNPMEKDTDGDEILDDVDSTPREKNRPINYILYDAANSIIYETVSAYMDYFNKFGMEYSKVPICTEEQFCYFFEYLEYGFTTINYDGWDNGNEEYKIESKGGLCRLEGVRYTRVDNLILVFHGGRGIMDVEHTDDGSAYSRVFANKFNDSSADYSLVNCSKIPIKNIDCQSCFAGYYDSNCKSIAIELLKATGAEHVYGATGELIYCDIKKKICFNSVYLGVYYMYFFDDNNRLVRKGGKIVINVMERWDNDHAPSVIIDDYPTY